MPLYDQHVHSKYSVDSKAEPTEIVEWAIARGLAGVTFTEHFDPHPDEWEECVYDDAAYSCAIQRLRETFGEKLLISKGIEIGYHAPRMDFVLDFLDRHEFDLVILSAHYFGQGAVHIREHWAGLDATEGTRRYLQTVLEMARFAESLHRTRGPIFHVLGHLDLVKRYTKRFLGGYDVSPSVNLIDEILRTCISAALTPEINTSTLRQNLDEPMPGEAVIARYAQLGGTAMTLGSDAHLAKAVGADFGLAVALLRNAGLNQALFKRGERVDLPWA